ncbi:hypothetical protein Sme01_15100 [Sphaerisporangium melleum]|uniref:Polyketide cyclase n=1 Tax=Sphaerisporangium melleum TaxID=321316 RepID=A0A917VEM2_9ACTN|nr:SRPBCC family protein [Sphaerisporangium melleum]GGK69547.1 hypothetical protein GCM10007964_10700 [Sphaerisporangium melleum]GII69034.1 hypothetical protein Sme01_15100 [Sphaerisporangium melleum]
MFYATSVIIRADVEKVWSILTDVERWPEWTPSVTSVRRLDEGPFALGSQARVEQPKLRPAVWTVTEIEPGVSFDWAARNPGVTTIGGHRLTARPNGTVECLLTIGHRGPLAPLIGLLTGSLTRRYLEMEATGLKHRAETT